MSEDHDPQCYMPFKGHPGVACFGDLATARADERTRLVLTYGGSVAMAAVRAEERERHGDNCRGMWDEWLHDLRAQVQEMSADSPETRSFRARVLDLIDGHPGGNDDRD